MTTWYVNADASGASDGNLGNRIYSPFKTLNRANDLTAPGDTILVYPAIYSEDLRIEKSGTSWIATEPGVVLDNRSASVSNTWTLTSGTIWQVNPGTFSSSAQGLIMDDDVLFTFPSTTGLPGITFGYEPQTHIAYNSFWHDKAGSGLLYVDLGGDDPNAHKFELLAINGIRADSLTDIYIEGWKIMGVGAHGVKIIGGANHVVKFCELTQNVSSGVRFNAPAPSLFKPVDGGVGSLAAGTYTWEISAIVGGVETLPGANNSLTLLSSSRAVVLEWENVVNATSYNIYGRGSTGRLFIASVPAVTVGFPTFTDDGSITPSGSSPPIITTYKIAGSLAEQNECYQNGAMGVSLFACDTTFVRGNKTYLNGLHGIGLQLGCNDNTIEFNHSFQNFRYNDRAANGIQVDFFGIGTVGSERNKVRRNYLFDNQDSGVSIYQTSHDCQVSYNVVYGNGDHGIDCLNSQNVDIVNNTVIGSVAAGIQNEGNSQGARQFNNIAVDNGINSPRTSGNYRMADATIIDGQMDYNVSYLTVPAASQPGLTNAEMVWGLGQYDTLADFQAAQPTQMTHGVSAPVYFVSPTHGDYRLKLGSAGIGQGAASALL